MTLGVCGLTRMHVWLVAAAGLHAVILELSRMSIIILALHVEMLLLDRACEIYGCV